MDCLLSTQVLESFIELRQAFYTLAASYYHDRNLYACLAHDSQQKHTRQIIFQAITQLEYSDNQRPRATLQVPALVGASRETLALIKAINQHKDNFKQALLALKQEKDKHALEQLDLQIDDILNKRHLGTKTTLHRQGLARLNLKQCYRHIPILEIQPDKVSWTWAHTKAIKRITVQQARTALDKKAALPDISAQIAKLATLEDNETLAIVQELAPHLRANVVWRDATGHSKRNMLAAALPIFYPTDSHAQPPIVSTIGQKQAKNQNRLTRSDQKIATDVFIPALRAHRYL